MPDHQQCRRRVCCIYWNRSSSKVDTIIVSGDRFEKGIKDHIDDFYCADDLNWSVSICNIWLYIGKQFFYSYIAKSAKGNSLII